MDEHDLDQDDDLRDFLADVDRAHLHRPLREAGESLAKLEQRLGEQGRTGTLRHLRQICVWSFSGSRKVTLPLLDAQALTNELVRRRSSSEVSINVEEVEGHGPSAVRSQ